MSEEEFAAALRELRGEYTAPSEVAEVCARLFEEQQRENGILRARLAQMEERFLQFTSNMQNIGPLSRR